MDFAFYKKCGNLLSNIAHLLEEISLLKMGREENE
jgi:hypothetical protein